MNLFTNNKYCIQWSLVYPYLLLSKPPNNQFQSDCLIRVFGIKCMSYKSVQMYYYTICFWSHRAWFHCNMFNHEEKILKSFMIIKSSLSIGAGLINENIPLQKPLIRLTYNAVFNFLWFLCSAQPTNKKCIQLSLLYKTITVCRAKRWHDITIREKIKLLKNIVL